MAFNWMGFGNERTQAQGQIDRQVVKRQLLLGQLDDTFRILNNYFNAINSGDRVTMGAQNEAAASVMNTLRAQVKLAQMRKDHDVLVMGLGKVADFLAQSSDLYAGNENVGAACKNYVAFMNAILCGRATDQLPCAPMPSDENLVNVAVGDLLGAVHDTDRRIREIENRPHETATQQAQLLRFGRERCLDSRGSPLIDVNYHVEEISGHFGVEKTYYDSSKSSRKEGAGNLSMETGPGGYPELGFTGGSGSDLYGDHRHEEDCDMTNMRLLRVGRRNWEEVEVIAEKGGQAEIRRGDGRTCVVLKSELRPIM